jgi:PIN domain nuclease of toxin-antitoxin system
MLLDTHAVIWWFEGSRRAASLPARLAGNPGSVRVSVVSLWEILMQSRLGKLGVPLEPLVRLIGISGWRILPVTLEHLRVLETLPAHHKDPFDHLLIAQAIAEDLTLVTDDRHMELYPVRCMACADRPMPLSAPLLS